MTASYSAMAMGMVFVASVPLLGLFSAAYLQGLFTVPDFGTRITASTGDPVPLTIMTLAWTLFVVALVLGGGCARLFGLALPARRKRWTVFIACALLSFGTLLFSTTAFYTLVSGWLGGRQESDIADAWESQSTSMRLLQSVDAGLFEEIMFLAVPAGLVLLVSGFRSTPNMADIGKNLPKGSTLWNGTGVAAAFIIVRFAMHTYQGWASALTVLLWTAVHLAIFRYSWTVLPLVLSHALFDFVVAGHAFWPADEAFTNTVTVLCFLSGAILLFKASVAPHNPGR